MTDATPVLRDEAARLAALGLAVANDMDNFAGSTMEQVQKGGVRQ